MKKYIKPAIEIVETNLSANYLQGGTSGPDINPEPGGGTMNSPKRKVYVVEEDDEDEEGFGW